TPSDTVDRPDTTPTVVVQPIETKRVDDVIYLTGVAEPWEAVTISSEIPGRIEWQGREEGDAVTAGDEIARINTTAIQARLDQARAEHKLSVQEFDRIRELRERGISSPQEYDRASTNRDAAEAGVRLAEVDFSHSVIRSGFDGTIDRLYNEAGEFVSVGAPLVRVVKVDAIKVLAGIPERDVPHFNPGDSVSVSFDALPDHACSGRIFRIATTAEPATRTFTTEIEIENADRAIKPGMIARVALVRASFPAAIAVPMFAVLSRSEGRFVFLEREGAAEMRSVDVGFFQDGEVLITHGLNAGDRLIVVGHRTLRDGDPVRVAAADR
ncbi:MAG: efflux RND transporter periplasmic adaptor subunit, partial [Gemmatimonadetes bacterium]|nr:efflux RND transporter periplasmic adaptor subunit [Gemmatimonadota bacterium]